MKLILSEEQQFLKDTAKSFARDKTPTTHFRKLRDDENAKCWDDSVFWQEMVATRLVWHISGLKNLVDQILELLGSASSCRKLGKTLTPSPILLATSVLGVSTIKFTRFQMSRKKIICQR